MVNVPRRESGFEEFFSPPEQAYANYAARSSRSLLGSESSPSRDAANNDAQSQECAQHLSRVKELVQKQKEFEEQLEFQRRIATGAENALRAKEAERDQLILRIEAERKKVPLITPSELPRNRTKKKGWSLGPTPGWGAEYLEGMNENEKRAKELEFRLRWVEGEITRLQAQYEIEKQREQSAAEVVASSAELQALERRQAASKGCKWAQWFR